MSYHQGYYYCRSNDNNDVILGPNPTATVIPKHLHLHFVPLCTQGELISKPVLFLQIVLSQNPAVMGNVSAWISPPAPLPRSVYVCMKCICMCLLLCSPEELMPALQTLYRTGKPCSVHWATHSWCGAAGSAPCFASEVIQCDIHIQQSLSL